MAARPPRHALATPERALPDFGSGEEPNCTEIVSRLPHQRSASTPRYALHGEFEYGGLPNVHLAFLEGAGGFRRAVVVQKLGRARSSLRGSEPLLSPDALLGCHARHPNVIPVLDVLEERGEHLLVLEYVISTTLGRLLRHGNRPPLPIGAAIVCDVLRALEAAHNVRDEFDVPLEIVHAGLSPDNVLLGVDGAARLIHFGQDRRGPARGGNERRAVGYVSPEQVFDQRADRRSDVFSSALLLWECVTGRPLLEGESAVDAMLRFMSLPSFAASAINPRVPKQVDALLARALEPTPERRFQSARAFAEELEALIEPASREDVARYVEGVAWCSIHEQELLLRGSEREALTPRVATSQLCERSEQEALTPRVVASQLCERSEPRASTRRASSSAHDDPTLDRGVFVDSLPSRGLDEAWNSGAPDELTKVDGIRPPSSEPDATSAQRELELLAALPKASATVEFPSGRRREHVPIYLWVALVVAALGLIASGSRTEFGRALSDDVKALLSPTPRPVTRHAEPAVLPANTLAPSPAPPALSAASAAPTARVLSIDELPVSATAPDETPPAKPSRKRSSQ